MFEVGFTEILLIFAIALLVLGPARLPKLAADVGRWAGRARAMARQLRTQLEQEVHFDPLQDQPKPASNTIHTPASQPAPVTEPVAAAPPTPGTTAEPPVVSTVNASPPPAVEPAAAPDRTDEPKPA